MTARAHDLPRPHQRSSAWEQFILDGGDIEVVATLQFDEAQQAWVAVPDWRTQRELAV